MTTKTTTLKPIIHVGYMISDILMQKNDYRNLWWVVWYNSETLASAGMEAFDTFELAHEWNEKNPPKTIENGVYDRSTIIFSGR
jgi:hypothetical protein